MSVQWPPMSRCIEATAGSGKTTLMVGQLTALLLDHQVLPEAALAITFTEKAATEMRSRLMISLQDAGCPSALSMVKRLSIETIHSFCNRLLKRHSLLINESPHYAILSGLELTRRLEMHAVTLWQSEINSPSDELIECLSTWSLDQWTAMLITAYHQRDTIDYWFDHGFYHLHAPSEDTLAFDPIYQKKCQAFQSAVTAFNHRIQHDKRANNWIDHDDILLKTHQLLANVDWLRHDYQDQLRHIFVDEFQDTSPIQWKIVHLLCGDEDPYESKKLWVVGDRCQAIYGFRGADDALMGMVIDTQSPHLEHVKNTHNYRSHPTIVTFINHLFERLFSDQSSDFLPMIPQKQPSGPAGVHGAVLDTKNDELAWIESTIRRMNAQGTPFEDMAILVRKNYDIKQIKSHLDHANIPTQINKGAGLCELDSIQIIIIFLMGWLDTRDDMAWYGIANDILTMPGDAIQAMMPENGGLYTALHATHPTVQEWARQLKTGHYLTSLCHLVWAIPIEWPANDSVAISRFLDEFKSQWEWVGGDRSQVLPWLEACLASPKKLGVENDTTDNAIHIMTLHAAKGLEFPMVMVPFLNAQFNMGASDPLMISRENGLAIRMAQYKKNPIQSAIYQHHKQQTILEELRLFYVTLTRAKSHLFLSGCELKRKMPCRLLLMLPHMTVKNNTMSFQFEWDTPNGNPPENSAPPPTKRPETSPPITVSSISMASVPPASPTTVVSVSELLDGLECPKKMHFRRHFPIEFDTTQVQKEGDWMHQYVSHAIAQKRTTIQDTDPDWLIRLMKTQWYEQLITGSDTRVEWPFDICISGYQIRGRFDAININHDKKTVSVVEFKRSLRYNTERYHRQVAIYGHVLMHLLTGYQYDPTSSYLVDLRTGHDTHPNPTDILLSTLLNQWATPTRLPTPDHCDQCPYHPLIKNCAKSPIVISS